MWEIQSKCEKCLALLSLLAAFHKGKFIKYGTTELVKRKKKKLKDTLVKYMLYIFYFYEQNLPSLFIKVIKASNQCDLYGKQNHVQQKWAESSVLNKNRLKI